MEFLPVNLTVIMHKHQPKIIQNIHVKKLITDFIHMHSLLEFFFLNPFFAMDINNDHIKTLLNAKKMLCYICPLPPHPPPTPKKEVIKTVPICL